MGTARATRAVIAVAGAAAVVLSAGVGAAGASDRHTDRAVVATPDRIVTLPTGDRIRVGTSPSGAPTYAPVAPVQARALRLGANQYVFPRSIDAVLGTVLDPELFNLRTIVDDAGRVPVTVTYADSAVPTPVPGVEITSRAGRTGRGYVTAASSRALGAALAHTPAATLFARVAAVRGGGGSAPARYPMHTLTLEAIGRDGRPATNSLIGYLNTTDPGRASGFAFAHQGVAKISVPAGTYEVSTAAPSADWSSFYYAATPQFRVAGPTSATVDLRSATTPFTTRLTAPTADPIDITDVTRAVGRFSVGTSVLATTKVYLSPTTGPMRGSLTVTRSEVATAPSGMRDGRYTLLFRHDGPIPAGPLTVIQRSADLARITDTFFTPPSDSASFLRATLPKNAGGWSIGTPLPVPGTIPELVTAGPDLATTADFALAVDPVTFQSTGQIESEWRDIPRAQVRTEEWNRGPVHPTSFDDRALWNGDPIRCDWCVRGDQLVLATLSGGDTDRWHVPYPMLLADGSSNVAWSVAADGHAVASGTDFLGVGGALTLPAGTKVVTATQTMVRPAPYTSGTRSVSSWTLPLAATRPLPAGYACDFGDGCRVLPFLSTAYDLPVDVGGVVLGGSRTLGIGVHQAGRVTPVGITSVTVKVDYGSGWRAVPVTALGGGRYAASLTVPWRSPSRTSADLLVTVHGADGSRFTDRISDAFLLQYPVP